MLLNRQRVAELYYEALSDINGIQLPCPNLDGNIRSWFVFVIGLPCNVDRGFVIDELNKKGIQSKPYLPPIHLMSFYREKFGYQPGQFPICEDFASRSLALPFFPQITEVEVERVVEALLPCMKERSKLVER